MILFLLISTDAALGNCVPLAFRMAEPAYCQTCLSKSVDVENRCANNDSCVGNASNNYQLDGVAPFKYCYSETEGLIKYIPMYIQQRITAPLTESSDLLGKFLRKLNRPL